MKISNRKAYKILNSDTELGRLTRYTVLITRRALADERGNTVEMANAQADGSFISSLLFSLSVDRGSADDAEKCLKTLYGDEESRGAMYSDGFIFRSILDNFVHARNGFYDGDYEKEVGARGITLKVVKVK